MNAIIKSGSDAGEAMVRPLAIATMRTAEKDTPLDTLSRRIAELEADIAKRDQRETGLEKEIEASFERGKEAGFALGVNEAGRLERERLELLEVGVQSARAHLAQSLAGAERLAVLIARDCLDKLLGEPDFRAETVRGLIRAQIAMIEQDAVVSIKVSLEDFPDDASFEDLKQSTSGVAFETDENLASGDCMLKLRLGGADIGLTQQWGEISRLLNEMGQTG